MRSNSEYMKNRPTDYLSLMGAPDDFAPSAPRYVNGHIVPKISKYRLNVRLDVDVTN